MKTMVSCSPKKSDYYGLMCQLYSQLISLENVNKTKIIGKNSHHNLDYFVQPRLLIYYHE